MDDGQIITLARPGSYNAEARRKETLCTHVPSYTDAHSSLYNVTLSHCEGLAEKYEAVVAVNMCLEKPTTINKPSCTPPGFCREKETISL